MVVRGRVRVTDVGPDGREHLLARFGPGLVFGEVAAASGAARTANVVAEEETDVLRLDWPALERVRRRFPFTGAKLFRNIAQILASRLAGGRPPLRDAVVPDLRGAGGPPAAAALPAGLSG